MVVIEGAELNYKLKEFEKYSNPVITFDKYTSVSKSTYYQRLIKLVVELSEADNWEDAVKEWKIIKCDEDEDCSSKCVCGKENIKYLFTIKNIYNSNKLFPIGSSCIKKFGREDLKDESNVYESMYKLIHAIRDNKFITLDGELFSRKLLRYLYKWGAFKSTQYNNYDGSNDYEFMLKMFNKKDKSTITPSQDKKIKAIILNSIKPFIQDKLYPRWYKGAGIW